MTQEQNQSGSGHTRQTSFASGDELARLKTQEEERERSSRSAEAADDNIFNTRMPEHRRGPTGIQFCEHSDNLRGLIEIGAVDAATLKLTDSGRASGITNEDVLESGGQSADDDVPPTKADASETATPTPESVNELAITQPSTLEEAIEEIGADGAFEYVSQLVADPQAEVDQTDNQFVQLETQSLAVAGRRAETLGVLEADFQALSDYVRANERFGDVVKAASMGDWSTYDDVVRAFQSQQLVAASRAAS